MKIVTFLFFLFGIITNSVAIETKVILKSGGNLKFRLTAEESLTTVLNAVNKKYELNVSLGEISTYFTKEAYRNFIDLIDKTRLYATQNKYESFLLNTTDGYYEVRNIKVLVSMGNTVGMPFQNLVFVLNNKGIIESAHFSIEEHHYQDIINQGNELKDLAYREKILHFIELYRTAYNRKELKFIENTLSDQAIIIVGKVVKTTDQKRDIIKNSYLDDSKIEFIRLGKIEYLKNLEAVFLKNDFVEVNFDEINILRHQQFQKIYGVQLKQRWNASRYSDEGYLFLMVDFMNEEEPVIHVRAWQPDKFLDGSTISIYDFEIVE